MSLKSILYGGLALTAVLLLVFAFSSDPDHPSDDRLIQRFHKDEADFNRLLAMSNEDPNVIRVAYDFTRLRDSWAWPRDKSKLGFSEQRWDEYRRMFRRLGLSEGIDRSDPGDSLKVFFIASTMGLSISGSAKGYAYVERVPSTLRDSLDSRPPYTTYQDYVYERDNTFYKPISGRWYLYIDMS